MGSFSHEDAKKPHEQQRTGESNPARNWPGRNRSIFARGQALPFATFARWISFGSVAEAISNRLHK
jgi:hypothetical protein